MRPFYDHTPVSDYIVIVSSSLTGYRHYWLHSRGENRRMDDTTCMPKATKATGIWWKLECCTRNAGYAACAWLPLTLMSMRITVTTNLQIDLVVNYYVATNIQKRHTQGEANAHNDGVGCATVCTLPNLCLWVTHSPSTGL